MNHTLLQGAAAAAVAATWAAVAAAQPQRPKTPLPPDTPAEVRQAVEGLYDKSAEARIGACRELARLGEAAAPAVTCLADLLHAEKDPRVRLAAVDALARYSADARARKAVTAAARDADPAVRARAVGHAARWHDDPSALQAAVKALADTDPAVRRAAAAGLARCSDPQVHEALLGRLQSDADAFVRTSAAAGLASFRDARAVRALTAALKDDEPRVRISAAGALAKLGPHVDISSAAAGLIALLAAEGTAGRCEAIQALCFTKDTRAVGAVVAALKDPSSRVRTFAAMMLRDAGDRRALEALIAALGDDCWAVQASAAQALGNLGDVRAVGPLAGALKHRFVTADEAARECLEVQQHVKRAACEALMRMGDAAVEALVGLLAESGADEALRRFPRAGFFALETLERMTGRRLGRDPEAWRGWWKAHKAGAATKPAAPPYRPWREGDGAVWREASVTVDWREMDLRYKVDPGANGANFPMWESTGSAPKRTYHTVELENRYLRIVVVPGAGAVVGRVVYKPTGADMFWWHDRADNGPVSWQSGLKPCFPYKEHGIRAVNQPASWRVVTGPDGGVTVAMWMEFSRFDGRWNDRMFAQYGTMLMAQYVTLRPDESAFRVRHCIFNPTPYRQGRQFWNDAIYPCQHTEAGVPRELPKGYRSKAEWIFPASHVSGHGGGRFRPYTTQSVPLGDLPGSSVFGWAMREAWAGLWYPEVRVNRLRITQPDKLPGAKQYYPGRGATHLELWTGTDSIFEEVENWIGPGERWDAGVCYTMTRGIGKVDFANDRAAVNVELEGTAPRVEAITYRPVEGLRLSVNGKAAGGPVPCGPATPARFALPTGLARARIALAAGGETLVDREFPIRVEPDEQGFRRIRDALVGEHLLEMLGNSATWERNYRHAIGRYACGTTDRGRVLYRDGQVDAALAELLRATRTDGGDGEAHHLLGAALLEGGRPVAAGEAFAQALEAERPYAPARYFLAVLALGRRQGSERAAAHLRKLLEQCPSHWDGRLLLAHLEGDPPDGRARSPKRAEELAAAEPADPRAQYVLWRAALRAGNAKLADEAKLALDALLAEPGTPRRLDEFQALSQGRCVHPVRMLSGQRIVFAR